MKRTVGFVILAHQNLFRVRQLVKSLVEQDAPIAVHIDLKVSQAHIEMLERELGGYDKVHFVPRVDVRWGEWSVVEATIRAVQLLLEKHGDLDYVYHISGACLPVRSMSELRSFLSEEKLPVDYIESVAVSDREWVKSGLDRERIELYHPFNWQTHRRLFNLSVWLQRRLNMRRKIPKEIIPSFGSQWWCLSTATLRRIFQDEEFPRYQRFFRSSWVPDESFFQTLARKHGSRIQSRSLTMATFDHMGKPFQFYNDHLPILRRIDRFFVRKIWRGASELYDHFLNPNRSVLPRDELAEIELMALLEHAKQRVEHESPGLVSQFQIGSKEKPTTTRTNYTVYVGFKSVQRQIFDRFKESTVIRQFGELFHPARAEYDISRNGRPRIAEDLATWRDYAPTQFLQQVIWSSFPNKIAFMGRAHHLRHIQDMLAQDENASIIMVRGAWLLDIYQRQIDNIERLRAVSQIQIQRENAFIGAFEESEYRASLHVGKVGEFLTHGHMIEVRLGESAKIDPPRIDREQFRQFVRKLSANGVVLRDYGLEAVMNLDNDKPAKSNVVPLRLVAR